MKISIGILAWNEQDRIHLTLESLLRQSVFQSHSEKLGSVDWQIVVVPNGCTDLTSTRSKECLSTLIQPGGNHRIQWEVVEIVEAGKSNAWNQFIHEFSDRDAELIILLDADIEFNEEETIEHTINALLSNPEAAVSVDRPLKDVSRKTNKTLMERIAFSASAPIDKTAPGICGQFYCARTEALRGIWLPKGLPVEDGFIYSMIVTDLFRSEVNFKKVVLAEKASHFFETLVSPVAIFNHEVRLVIGTELNCYFGWDFLKFGIDPEGSGAGMVIKNNLKKNPMWYRNFINNSIRKRGFWVLPMNMFFRRFHKISMENGLFSMVKKLAFSLVASVIDLPILIVANHKLRSGKAIGHW